MTALEQKISSLTVGDLVEYKGFDYIVTDRKYFRTPDNVETAIISLVGKGGNVFELSDHLEIQRLVQKDRYGKEIRTG